MTKLRDDKYLIALGKRVRELRIEKGYSTYVFEVKSNVSRSQLQRIETGRGNCTVSTLKAVADTLEVSVSELMDF
jgi:transcriptional regulator with XRE-family HTH domain